MGRCDWQMDPGSTYHRRINKKPASKCAVPTEDVHRYFSKIWNPGPHPEDVFVPAREDSPWFIRPPDTEEWIACQRIQIFIAPIHDLAPGIGHIEIILGRELMGTRIPNPENPAESLRPVLEETRNFHPWRERSQCGRVRGRCSSSLIDGYMRSAPVWSQPTRR
jgi:hypothetical protein